MEGEWQVQRGPRRKPKASSSGSQSQSKYLSTPVIPSGAFAALAPEDEPRVKTEEERERERKKKKAAREKKKRSNQANQALQGQQEVSEEGEEGEGQLPCPPSSFSKPPSARAPSSGPAHRTSLNHHPPGPPTSAAAAAAAAKGAASLASPSSLLQSLLALLRAALAWLQAVLGLGAKKKNKSKKPPVEVQASAKEQQQQQQQQNGHATTKAATPSEQEQDTHTPALAPKAASSQGTQGTKAAPSPSASAPSAPRPAPESLTAAPPPSQAASRAQQQKQQQQQQQQQKQQQRQQEEKQSHPPPPQARVFQGPGRHCDPAWKQGSYLVSEQEEAHADCVSSVAIAGQVAVTTGYDGSVKVWSLCSEGGPPTLIKPLTGHSGRVEAVCADTASQRAVTSGRDSSLKVWALGTTPQTAASSHLLHSHYVYESVRCLAVDWNASPPVAALGATSGNISLFELDTGRKLGVLKRLDAEVSAVLWMAHPDSQPASADGAQQASSNGAQSASADGGMQGAGSKQAAAGLLVSGSMDGGLMVWDVRQPRTAVLAGRLQGTRKRVCSLAASSYFLYVGDYSSSIKVYDMLKLAGPSQTIPPVARLPAAPSADAFGDVCPVAGIIVEPNAKVLLNSGIAWWSDEHWEALVEASEDEPLPTAVLNVHAVEGQAQEYLNTVRLGNGIITCAALQGSHALVGCSSGSIFSVAVYKRRAEGAAGSRLCTDLLVGCEELEEEEDEDESDSEDGEGA